ncbi:MAG: Vms1/Ankzf1 family peptidyl-tRNA hydrolase [Actinomycetota bacterium]
MLSEFPPGGAPVLTAYFNLEPTEFAMPHARQTQLVSLIDEAQKQLDERGDHSPEALQATALVQDFVSSEAFPADGNGGVAMFVCPSAGMFVVLTTLRPVQSRAIVSEAPALEQLADYISQEEWATVLVSRHAARAFRGDADRLQEILDITADVHGRHKQGGWSAARYERSIGKEVDRHMKAVAKAIAIMDERDPFDFLVVGATPELWANLERNLRAHIRDRVIQRVDIDVEFSTMDELAEKIRPVIQEQKRKLDREALDQLAQGLGRDERAVNGYEPVMNALHDRRVGTLLLPEGRDVPPEVIDLALAQAADVRIINLDDAAPVQDVAALLRF